jgi:hypothetical protein
VIAGIAEGQGVHIDEAAQVRGDGVNALAHQWALYGGPLPEQRVLRDRARIASYGPCFPWATRYDRHTVRGRIGGAR